MRCPYCATLENKVIDSRLSQGGEVIRRRRECEGCGRRYTPYERVEQALPGPGGLAQAAAPKLEGGRQPIGGVRVQAIAGAQGGRRVAAARKATRHLAGTITQECAHQTGVATLGPIDRVLRLHMMEDVLIRQR